MESGKKVTYSLKTLQSATTLKPGSADSATADTKVLTFKKGGTYAFSVESINAAKGGDAYYTVAVNQAESALPAAQNADAVLGDALALPETSVSLEMPDALASSGSMEDSLNFGQTAVSDVIAEGAAFGRLDGSDKLDDKAAWQDITTLA